LSNPKLDSKPKHDAPPVQPRKEREERRHPRHALAVRCWISDERHAIYLRLHDLSRGGLSVRAPVPFAPATNVEVGLELPDGRRVRAHGQIVWVRASATATSGPRMGARFLEFVEGEEDLYRLLGNA
jgi:hypothetical protein